MIQVFPDRVRVSLASRRPLLLDGVQFLEEGREAAFGVKEGADFFRFAVEDDDGGIAVDIEFVLERFVGSQLGFGEGFLFGEIDEEKDVVRGGGRLELRLAEYFLVPLHAIGAPIAASKKHEDALVLLFGLDFGFVEIGEPAFTFRSVSWKKKANGAKKEREETANEREWTRIFCEWMRHKI